MSVITSVNCTRFQRTPMHKPDCTNWCKKYWWSLPNIITYEMCTVHSATNYINEVYKHSLTARGSITVTMERPLGGLSKPQLRRGSCTPTPHHPGPQSKNY